MFLLCTHRQTIMWVTDPKRSLHRSISTWFKWLLKSTIHNPSSPKLTLNIISSLALFGGFLGWLITDLFTDAPPETTILKVSWVEMFNFRLSHVKQFYYFFISIFFFIFYFQSLVVELPPLTLDQLSTRCTVKVSVFKQYNLHWLNLLGLSLDTLRRSTTSK